MVFSLLGYGAEILAVGWQMRLVDVRMFSLHTAVSGRVPLPVQALDNALGPVLAGLLLGALWTQVRDGAAGAALLGNLGVLAFLYLSIPELAGVRAASSAQQASVHPGPHPQPCSASRPGTAQLQFSPRQASRPSLTATAATARAAKASNHHQPNKLLASRPASTAAAR